MNYSILMSVYKKEKVEYLISSIESMLSQTVPAEQFVIVKDGPLTEELDQVIRSYAEKNPELFTILPLTENVGLGRALDYGMAQCRNELVARMDSDDISLPTRCEQQLECFSRDASLSIVGTYINEFENDPDVVMTMRTVPTTNDEIVAFARRRSPFNHPTVMYKKSDVIRCGGYGVSKRKEDLYLFLAMVNQGCRGQNIPQPLLLYRADAGNLERRKSWVNCKESIQAFYKNYKSGYSKFTDLVIVSAAQIAFYLMPAKLAKVFSDRFLRSKKQH